MVRLLDLIKMTLQCVSAILSAKVIGSPPVAQHVWKFEMYVSSFPFVQFKFSVYGLTHADRHIHASCNAVPLVWGSLRLAPIGLMNFIKSPKKWFDQNETSRTGSYAYAIMDNIVHVGG